MKQKRRDMRDFPALLLSKPQQLEEEEEEGVEEEEDPVRVARLVYSEYWLPCSII